jgi:hypothetical protein
MKRLSLKEIIFISYLLIASSVFAEVNVKNSFLRQYLYAGEDWYSRLFWFDNEGSGIALSVDLNHWYIQGRRITNYAPEGISVGSIKLLSEEENSQRKVIEFSGFLPSIPPSASPKQYTIICQDDWFAIETAPLDVYRTGCEIYRRTEIDGILNSSARGYVSKREPYIFGFVISGLPKIVMMRCMGGSLSRFGVEKVAQGLSFELYNNFQDRIGDGKSWSSGGAEDKIYASLFSAVGACIPEAKFKEPVLVALLSPGAYTVVCSAEGEGVCLVETYLLPYHFSQ